MIDLNSFSMITLNHYLVTGLILFALGFLVVLIKHNLVVILMGVELMLNAVNLLFIAYSSYFQNLDGQIIVFFIMTLAAAEAGVGLAIAVSIFKKFKEVNISFFETLRG